MLWALPGFFGLPSDWDELDSKIKCRRPALWKPDQVDLTMPDWGEQFARRVNSEDADPVLLGYSLGGRLALHALLAPSANFRAAILVSTHFGLTNSAEKLARLNRDETWAEKIRVANWNELHKEWNAQTVMGGAVPNLARDERFFVRELLARGMISWSLGNQSFLVPRLHEIKIPVLLITGERDDKFSELAEQAQVHFGYAKRRVISGAGHRVPWHQPDIFSEEVGRFLSKI